MSQTVAYVLGIVVLVIGIGLSVALHELGHMIPAKRFGVKVPEYFIGFGPRLWSFKRGETEYGVKAIWLGGYVKLLGMVPPAKPGRADKPDSMVADARAESLAELGPDEQHRAFYRLSVPKKLIVMAGGILTNLALGVILLALALGVVGQSAYTSTLSSVSACVPADVDAAGACADADAPSPAAAAGLRVGDEIRSWNGTPTATWAQVQQAIRASGTVPAAVVVERDGQELTLTVTAVEVPRTVYAADGSVVTGADGEPLTEQRPYVGIGPALGTQRTPPSQIPAVVGTAVGQTLRAIVTLPVGLYHAVAARQPGRRGQDRGRGLQRGRGLGHRALLGAPVLHAQPPGLAQPGAVRLQPHPPAAPGRRARRRGPVGGGPTADRARARAPRPRLRRHRAHAAGGPGRLRPAHRHDPGARVGRRRGAAVSAGRRVARVRARRSGEAPP